MPGCLCTTTVTTVYYLAHKALGSEQARANIRNLLRLFEVAPVSRAVLEGARLPVYTPDELWKALQTRHT